ncbi:MAG: hypothetical protein M3R66_05245 [Actinomycetota bacterium]|nr:hypothetical protein [Actinomycetota bacterium]
MSGRHRHPQTHFNTIVVGLRPVGSTWTQRQRLLAPTNRGNVHFGIDVAWTGGP